MKKTEQKTKVSKAQIKKQKAAVSAAIKELVRNLMLEGGLPAARAKKISLQAGKEELRYIEETAKTLIANHNFGGLETDEFPV